MSSIAYRFGRIGKDKDDLNSEKSYIQSMAYANSKLANILFTRELSRRLADSRVTVNALHPGVINTELVRNIGSSLKYFQDVLVRPFQFMFFKTPLEGAQTTLFAG